MHKDHKYCGNNAIEHVMFNRVIYINALPFLSIKIFCGFSRPNFVLKYPHSVIFLKLQKVNLKLQLYYFLCFCYFSLHDEEHARAMKKRKC